MHLTSSQDEKIDLVSPFNQMFVKKRNVIKQNLNKINDLDNFESNFLLIVLNLKNSMFI